MERVYSMYTWQIIVDISDTYQSSTSPIEMARLHTHPKSIFSSLPKSIKSFFCTKILLTGDH